MTLFKFPSWKKNQNISHTLIGQCPYCYQSIAQCRCAPVLRIPDPTPPAPSPPQYNSLNELRTIDELWAAANAFGRVKMEQNHSKTTHEVAIMFNTKAGSYVSAKGEAPDAAGALRAAIKEAAALQCGVEFANS